MNLGIKTKLGVILGVFVFLIIASVAVTYWTISSVSDDSVIINMAGRERMLAQKYTKEVLDELFPAQVRSSALKGAEIARVQTREGRTNYAKDTVGKLKKGGTAYEKTAEVFETTLDALINGGNVPLDLEMKEFRYIEATSDQAIMAQLNVVKKLWDKMTSSVQRLMTLKVNSPEYMRAYLELKRVNMEVTREMNKAVKMYEAASTAKLDRMFNIMVVFLMVAIVVAIGGWWFANRVVVRPVREVVELAEAVAGGDLTATDVKVNSHDEMGALASAINRMKANLKDIISRMRATSENIASASHQLAASSSQIVKGADKQSAQTNQVANAMEEMSASVIEVAKNSQDASQYASRTHDIAQKGGEIVEKAVDGMLNVADTVKKSATTVEVLGKSSEEIGHIIAVINDIADQTNLLALNAAIEAARAGEQGRGFAVVADEVRKLAEKTTKATKEIRDMIASIQKETGEAIRSMHNGTKQVEEGVALAKEAGEALRSIVASVEKVSDMVRQIATAAEEQSATTEEISQNISTIAGISVETADGVKQISNATDEMSRIAEQLRKLVETFRLENTTEEVSILTDRKEYDKGQKEGEPDSPEIIKVVGG